MPVILTIYYITLYIYASSIKSFIFRLVPRRIIYYIGPAHLLDSSDVRDSFISVLISILFFHFYFTCTFMLLLQVFILLPLKQSIFKSILCQYYCVIVKQKTVFANNNFCYIF